jgi:hypothetical protein
MEQLEIDYPDVQFVYMTGHLEGQGPTGNVFLANQQIRDHCIANNKILYDFADIEKYDPDCDTNWQDYFANDACDYQAPGGGTENWADNWIAANPAHQLTLISQINVGCAHSRQLNCTKKGVAAWFLWARLAGWNDQTTQPTSNFNMQDTSIISHTVDITYSGNASPSATYNWDFDGASIISGSGQGPYTVQWPDSGDKTVALSVEESGNMSDTTYNDIFIEALTSYFQLPDTACVVNTIEIVYIGNAADTATYSWDFDGASVISGSGQGPYMVQWPDSGSKIVSLSVHEGGFYSDTTTNDIYIEHLSSDFILPDTSCRSCIVEIIYAGNASDTAVYNWDFDSANIISGSGQGPYTVEWPTDGDKTVSLAVEEAGFVSDTTLKDIYIVFLTSDFQMPDTSCIAHPVEVFYTGNASASATYYWDFDSANVISGSGQGPYTLQWSGIGDKTVSLYVEEFGFITDTTIHHIHIEDLTSDFQLQDIACIFSPVEVVYTGNASDSAIYAWDFDGANIISGSGQGPYMVQWLSLGDKTVSLYVEESGFMSDTSSSGISIHEIPSFTIIPYPNDTASSIDTITLTGDITSVSYLWSTGDTTQSIDVICTCGSSGGSQDYWLEVTNEAGCTSKEFITVVFEGPTSISDYPGHLEIKAYPNPFTDKLNVELEITETGVYVMELIDRIGLPVLRESKQLIQGRQMFSIEMNHTDPGMYILSIKSDRGQLGLKKVVRTIK